DAEEEANADGDAEGHQHRRQGDQGRGESRDQGGQPAAVQDDDQDAQRAADAGQEHRLDQELGQDVTPPSPDRLPDADLARPFGDGDQHDVHDPDAADHQGDAGDGAQHQGEDAGGLRSAAQDVLLAQDLEVRLGGVRDVVPVQQDLGDFIGGHLRGLGAASRHVDLLHVPASTSQQVVPGGGDRGHHHVVLIVEAGAALAGEDADYPEALPVELDHLADGVGAVEEAVDHRLSDHGHLAG